ncbi:hypothetical protein B0H16DRAFT_1373024, partial [Mycena metata]
MATAAFSINLPFEESLAQTFMCAVRARSFTACILNDICSIDLDRKVERTKNRPLVTGAISAASAATLLSIFVLLWGLPGIFPFSALYPLITRWRWWPQLWLGM